MDDPTQKDKQLHIVLVEPEVHWNTGNVGRTCLALNAVLHLVRPLGFSLSDAAVRRSGLDYWSKVNLSVWDEWSDLAERLPSMGQAFFLSPEAEKPYWAENFSGPTVLIFGSEGKGLPQHIREAHADQLLRIPACTQEVRSLNLSTCVGITAYEVLRQRSRPSL